MITQPKELTLQISGMDCAGCARTVEQGVANLDGVDMSKVIFTSEKLQVSGDVQRDTIVKRVRELGYDVVETPEGGESEAGADQRERNILTYMWGRRDTRLALLAGLLIIPGIIVTEFGGMDFWWANLAAVAAMALAGFPVARSGWNNLRINHNLNINALMTIAATGGLIIGTYTEAAMIMVLFVLGEALEGYTAGNACQAITSLMDVAPNTATCRIPAGHRNGAVGDQSRHESSSEEETVNVDDLAIGDIVIVKPGERAPMDGRVVAGVSAVNQAPITGESVPVDKSVEDEVFAGSVNGIGVLEIEVTHLAKDNTISRIVQLVQEAQESQAPTQRYVDRFAAYYTPAVVVLAALVAILPPLIFGAPFLNPEDGTFGWLYRGLALLVVACPCALVISTPVSIISGISNAARNGILIKGGIFLEKLNEIKVIAFDKTGTLTQGRPAVVGVRADGCETSARSDADCPVCDDLIALAGAIEQRSEHPFGQAVVAEADRRQVLTRYPAGSTVSAMIGNGIVGMVDSREIMIGSHAYFDGNVPHTPQQCSLANAEAQEGLTPVMVSVEGSYRGTITVADTVRESSRDAVQDLYRAGIVAVAMLTGDSPATANAIAGQIGVTDVRAGLAPGDKSTAVNELRETYGPIAMVGDGINDAPALASADVGIAIGAAYGGTAQAMETADIALMSDDLSRLPYALLLGNATMRTIRTNIAFSIGIKIIFMILVVLGMSTMWMAVAADVGVSLLVTFYGLRLLRWNPPASSGVRSAT